jgi:hypothetical protein
MSRYTVSFKHVGAAYDEALMLFQELNERGNWREVVRAAYEENFLKKRSPKWIEVLLRYMRRRYLEDHSPLPGGKILSKFLYSIDSDQARIQILYQYICETHPLVDKLVVGLVGSNLIKHNSFRLTRIVFSDFFSKEAEGHPELNEWADNTKEKWRRDFNAFLRSSGLMEKHPSVIVRKFVIRPETFAFFLYGLIDEGLSPSEIFDSRLWKRYFLRYEEIEEKLSECQVRGWLDFRGLGTIFELDPKYDSLREWMSAFGHRKI